MLAWWTLIPFAVYLLCELTVGWSVARSKGSSDYAAGYLMGGIFGGVLISSILAAIVYGVSRKSQLAASSTFCIVMGLASISVLVGQPDDTRAKQAIRRTLESAEADRQTAFGDVQAFRSRMPAPP